MRRIDGERDRPGRGLKPVVAIFLRSWERYLTDFSSAWRVQQPALNFSRISK